MEVGPEGYAHRTHSSPTRPLRGTGRVEARNELVIVDDRVTSVIGKDTAIWSIAAVGAHNDIMRRLDDLVVFAKTFRSTLDAIKAAHGEQTGVHLFPAIPVSAAVEAGGHGSRKPTPPSRIY